MNQLVTMLKIWTICDLSRALWYYRVEQFKIRNHILDHSRTAAMSNWTFPEAGKGSDYQHGATYVYFCDSCATVNDCFASHYSHE